MSSARQTRHLQTASAYQPHTLQPPPTPPRNTGIPDTSIAGGKPEVNETRPPRLTEHRGFPAAAASDKNSSVSVTEGEAQKSKPAFHTEPAPSPAPTKRPSRFKFKPKKAAMTLTPSAVSALRELLDQPEPKLIRVGTKNKGCSGLAYHLEYVDKPGKFDDAVEQDGVKVLIDSKALIHILGSEMDWVEDKLSRRFVFRNPNITEQCGCGESFSVN
ncbi:FeS cluster biogenesis [Macrophomina phaseolina MS6]|uniref:Iron-sulfur assembly protein 1 n=2 Tax=Macrophomina phaseolina TaxID=35725 RepID=K2SMI6_MACPH|nr:FeS cluster biogenesis [Macrophomina phaseolina MS6]